jgi:hypothetical protein
MSLSDLIRFPHFLIILLGIILLTIALIFIFKHKPKKWRLLHEITASIGIFLILLGIIILGGLNLIIIHGSIGLISFIVLILILIIGLIAVKQKTKKLRNLHIWIGRIIYFLTLITAILGIILFL